MPVIHKDIPVFGNKTLKTLPDATQSGQKLFIMQYTTALQPNCSSELLISEINKIICLYKDLEYLLVLYRRA